MVMIETVEAMENAEANLSVEGVTGCFIGPADLALSMGVPVRYWVGHRAWGSHDGVLVRSRNSAMLTSGQCMNGR